MTGAAAPSALQVHAGGGMDNPVEVTFSDQGEIFGTANIFQAHSPFAPSLYRGLHRYYELLRK